MAFVAAAGLLGAVANIGQVTGLGMSHVHQGEQTHWARRAYRLDARTLRIDLLNAVKEDVRDHHTTHAGRIDTLLLVHTLLLTFALSTLQFSNQYVPQTADSCSECVEVDYPILVSIWVYLIVAILILPFWCILMLLWCKLQLDRWLELSVRRLNFELRSTLQDGRIIDDHSPTCIGDAAGRELESVEDAISRLGGFVADHQDRFARVWGGECEGMVAVTINLLWVNVVVAITITAGMFWMFLRNDLERYHAVATNFLVLVGAGLLAPFAYLAAKRLHGAEAGGNSVSAVERQRSVRFDDDDGQASYQRLDSQHPSLMRRPTSSLSPGNVALAGSSLSGMPPSSSFSPRASSPRVENADTSRLKLPVHTHSTSSVDTGRSSAASRKQVSFYH